MKIIKPLKQGLLQRTFENDHRFYFVVTTLSFFDFNPAKGLLPETEMWGFAAEELGNGSGLDLGMPKPKGEVLVLGSFFAPESRPVRAGRVRLSFSDMEKTLFVFGDRYWKKLAGTTRTISEPTPVQRLKIDYAHAFGGPGFEKNPLGKGFRPVISSNGRKVHPLPNIEDPASLIGSPKQRQDPAGFGPIDMMWPQRFAKAGTYDAKWLRERFPGLPEDLDWSYYNTAPQDQQAEGFWSGNEAFAIENMHPEEPYLQGRLPGFRSRCFVNHKIQEKAVFKEIDLRLDTVWLFPHARKGILAHRGVMEISTDDAEDVSHLLVAYERLSDAARSSEHYQRALEHRLDKDKGYLFSLKESDLIPDGERSAFKDIMESEEAALLTGEGLLTENMKKRADLEKEKLSAELRQAGLDPKSYDFSAAQAPDIDIDHLESLDELLEQAHQRKKDAEEQAKKLLAEQGLDYDDLSKGTSKDPSSQFRFSAAETVRQLRELGVQDPEGEEMLYRTEELLKAAYKDYGHHFPACVRPEPSRLEAMKQEVRQAYEQGESFAGKDLTGIDLAGLDLRGIDLSGAFLEGADLTGCNLEEAHLQGAVLVRAKLDQARFVAANLSASGLGEASCVEADLERANLANAVLIKADLSGAKLAKARLEEADLSEAVLNRCDLSEASLKKCRLLDTKLEKAVLAGADLSEALLLNVSLSNSDLSRANLASAIMVQVNADASILREAAMENIRMLGECSFKDSSFSRARLVGANLRGTDFSRSNFSYADISESDFGQCLLQKADFRLAKAVGARFGKADLSNAQLSKINLFKGSLQKALLEYTNLQQANLSLVDFMRVRFRNTDVSGANLSKSYIERWIPR